MEERETCSQCGKEEVVEVVIGINPVTGKPLVGTDRCQDCAWEALEEQKYYDEHHEIMRERISKGEYY